MIGPVPRIGAGDGLCLRTIPTLQMPRAERLAHERRTASVFERVLRAEQLALAQAKESERARSSWPQVFVFFDKSVAPMPHQAWQLWPAHPAFADEIHRWWPSDEHPPAVPEVRVEDQKPDRPPDVVLMPARGGLFDVWI